MIIKVAKRKRKRICIYRCNGCSKLRRRSYSKSFYERTFHFCKVCIVFARRKGGLVDQQKKLTNVERFGFDHPLKSPKSKIRFRETSIANWGVVHPSKSPLVKSKIEETMYKNHGVKHSLSSPIVREKIVKTTVERFGVKNSSHSSIVKQKIALSNEKTCIERYGVKNVMYVDEVQIKQRNHAKNTLLQKYDVVNPMQLDDAKIKRHKTMKHNASFQKSKPEDLLFQILTTLFGDVQRQVLMNSRWPIDFYVKSIDTYVQYDGYWHGYKRGVIRNINEVAEFKNKHDTIIHRKMLIDVEQNQWFSEQGLKLVRILCNEYQDVDLVRRKLSVC